MPFVADTQTSGFRPDKKTFGGFVGNLVDSTGKLVGDTASAIIHPVQTAKSLYGLGSGIVQLLIPGEQGNEKIAKAVGKFYADRYGGLDKAWNSFYNDPAGVAADLSTVLGIGAGAFKVAGMGKTAKVLSTASKIADPLNIGSKLPKQFKGASLKMSIGNNLEDLGNNMAFSGLHDPKIQKNIRAISGKTPLQLSEQYQTWSRDPASVQRAIEGIDALRSAKLKGKTVDIRQVMKDLNDSINILDGDISDNANIQRNYLIAKREEISRAVNSMGSPEILPDTGWNELNPEMKRTTSVQPILTRFDQPAEMVVKLRKQIGKDIPKNGWNVGAADSAKGEAAKSIYRSLKNRINEIDPSLKQAGKDESALIRMKELFENEQARSAARNNISLGDQIIGTGAYAMGKLPAMAATLATKKLITSPRGVEVASKMTAAAGKAIKNASVPKKAKNVFSLGYQAGRLGRMTNAQSPQSGEPIPKTIQTKSLQSYKPSVPQPASTPYVEPEKIKAKSNVFKSKSSFGKIPRVRVGNFV